MMGFRKWLAWRLVRIAHRLYDPEWLEHVTFVSPAGNEYRLDFISDEYGCGLSSTSGIHWQVVETGESAEVEGWKFSWPHAVRYGYADE